MQDNDDTMWLTFLGIGAAVLFGGAILGFIGTQAQTARDWLVDRGVLVSEAQALIAIDGVGVDLARLIIGVALLMLIIWVLGGASRRLRPER